MSEKQEIVTIDGPSGVGKSTVSRKVAAALGFTYLDTGAMYRGVGLFLLRRETDLDDSEMIAKNLQELELRLLPAADENSDVGVMVNGEIVSDAIRTPDMAMVASKVSAVPVVRDILTKMQRRYGDNGQIVAEGRDTGTVVFPKAGYKYFLDADPEERAERRCKQLREKGIAADFYQILAMTIERDKNDRQREVAPLKQAAEATLINTSSMTIDKVVREILAGVKRKR